MISLAFNIIPFYKTGKKAGFLKWNKGDDSFGNKGYMKKPLVAGARDLLYGSAMIQS